MNVTRVFATAAAFLMVAGLPSPAQQLDAARPTHEDDLVIGPLKVTILVRPESTARPEPKEVTLLFLTKTKFVYRDKSGPPIVRSDGTWVTKISTEKPKNEWEWDAATKAFKGPLLPPPPIKVTPDKLSKNQLTGYLAVRAEFLHLELDNAISRRQEDRVKEILIRAGLIRDFANKEGLGSAVASLYELEGYVDTQNRLLKQQAEAFQTLQKLKINESRSLDAVRRAFQAQATVNFLRLVATGATQSAGTNDNEAQKFENALGALGDLGQAVAHRDLDERLIKEAANLYEDRALAEINRIRATLKENRVKLAGAPKVVWDQLGVMDETVRRLDSLAGNLLEKRDLAAALAILDNRTAYIAAKGFQSPQLISLINTIKAIDEARKPQTSTERAERSERIFKLAKEVIASTQLIPDDEAFLQDRLQVLTVGGKLTHLAVTYAQDPRSGALWSESWDPRADYAARALDLARSREGTVADPTGAARSTRAALLFERGLHLTAMEEGRKLEDVVGIDALSLVNLARYYSKTGNPKEAAAALQKSFNAGFRATRIVETDPDLQPMWAHLRATKGDMIKYRESPELDAFVDNNPLTVANSFPSYSLEIKNKTSYPVTNVKVKFLGKFIQVGKAVEVSSQELTIEYLGPVGTPNDTFFWPDAFKTPGKHSTSILKVTADRKLPSGKQLQGNVVIKASDRSIFRPYWYYYQPYWYIGP